MKAEELTIDILNTKKQNDKKRKFHHGDNQIQVYYYLEIKLQLLNIKIICYFFYDLD